MKILHISTDDHAGAGLCCMRIHQSLLKIGVESKMVVLHNTQHAEGEYQYGYLRDKIDKLPSKLLRYLGVELTIRNKRLALERKYHTAYSLPVSPIDITKCEWIEWADIIHLHWVNNYVDYPSFLGKIKKPIVWTLHDENLFYGMAHHHKSILKDNPLEQKYRQIKYNAVRSTESLSIVFLSEMMYKKFGDEKIIEGRIKTIINNAVNTEVFQPKNREVMRRKYGIDIHKRIFIFISMNIADPNKGLDIFSEVLLDLDPTSEILAIGDNPWKKEWKNVRSVGLVKSQQEMCELISCADYMAMPSFQEAFSQSPLEAMACGLPVVLFPVSGSSELINESNGVVCDDFTSESLRKGLVKLMSRKYDSSLIRQDMINRFSPKAMARKYVKLYKEICCV